MPSLDWVTPGFDIVRTAHVEFIVSDLEVSRAFYVDQLGLVVSAETEDALYLRGYEERLHHSLVLRRGLFPMVDHIAMRVRSDSDLDSLATFYERLGCKTREVSAVEIGQGRALRVFDPLGFPLEFFFEMEHVESLLQHYELHRGARIMRADHANLYVADVAAAYDYYRELGFRCSEYIASDPEDRLVAAWLYRRQSVHDIALTTGSGPRMHHFAFTAANASAITDLCDQLAGAHCEKAIERGPGRHGVSNAFFVYLRDPDGHRIELYVGDYYTGDPDHQPIRWSTSDDRRRTFWGRDILDTWFEQGSLVRGADGAIAELREAILDERTVAAE